MSASTETENFKDIKVGDGRASEAQGQSGPIPVYEDSKKPGGVKKMLTTTLLSLGLVGALAGGFAFYQWSSVHEQTDDAYVDGHSSAVSSRVSGTVAKVFIDDNQIVKKGDLLATLDPTDYQIKVDIAQAAVDLAQKQIGQSHASVKQYSTTAEALSTSANGEVASAQAQVAMARSAVLQSQSAVTQQTQSINSLKAKLWQAQVDFKRYSELYSKGAVSQEELDQARTTYTVAQADEQGGEQLLLQMQQKVQQSKDSLAQSIGMMTKSQSTLKTAQASKDEAVVKQQDVEVSKAQLEQAQANLKEAKQNLAYTQIYAPIAGRVGRKNLEPGQRIDVGTSIASIFEENPWITANYKETQTGRMKPGQEVEIKIDSFGGRVFKGTIDSIAPASGAKYALLPPENATGNFTKVVQRIPIKIVFDKESIGDLIKRIAPGMSTDVTVDLKSK